MKQASFASSSVHGGGKRRVVMLYTLAWPRPGAHTALGSSVAASRASTGQATGDQRPSGPASRVQRPAKVGPRSTSQNPHSGTPCCASERFVQEVDRPMKASVIKQHLSHAKR